MEDAGIKASASGGDGGNEFAIHLAAREGNVTLLQMYLIRAPELLDLSDEENYTPLDCAISADKPEAVRFLLEEGADPTLKEGHLVAKEEY